MGDHSSTLLGRGNQQHVTRDRTRLQSVRVHSADGPCSYVPEVDHEM